MKRNLFLMFTFLITWLMPLPSYSLTQFVDYDEYVFGYESSEIRFSWVTDEDGEEIGINIWGEAIDFNIINSIPKQVECVFYKHHYDENGNYSPVEVARRTYSFTEIHHYNGNTQVIVIPDFIKRIGNNAFSGNTNITEIVIPETLKDIGEDAFSNTNITKLIIPETLKGIGGRAFSHCENLSFVSIKANDNLKCGAYPFMGCPKLETVIFEEGTTIIPDGICCNCTELKNITLPSTLIRIGGAFRGCTSLEEIEFPDRLEEIGEAAFDGDKSLKEITLPNSLTKIGRQAFARCSSLTKVISLIQEPFDVDITTFWESNVCQEYWYGKYIKVTNADLYVPAGTKKKYEDLVTNGFNAWMAFNNIIEMETTGIEDHLSKYKDDNNYVKQEKFDIYTLTGNMLRKQVTSLEGLPRGIYIVNHKKVEVK